MKEKLIPKKRFEELVVEQKLPIQKCLALLGITKCTFYRKMKKYGLRLVTKSYYAHNKGKRILNLKRTFCEVCQTEITRRHKRCLEHRDIDRNYFAENNPNWRGGVTPVSRRARSAKTYKQWRSKVFERDNYTCQGCGKRGGWLEADHIKPFSLYPTLRTVVSNGRTLCRPCHLTLGWNPYPVIRRASNLLN